MNFENKHLKNCKLLSDRTELLKLLPKNMTIAEIGVDQGDFSQQILNICSPSKLHLIDLWQTKRYHKGKQEAVENRFKNQIKNKTISIHNGSSLNQKFKNEYFDFIYIDTTHSYEQTLKELIHYQPMMKKGGIIGGHDYISGNWSGGIKYGVIEAVREFCLNYDWRLIYLTTELTTHPSFAIVKI